MRCDKCRFFKEVRGVCYYHDGLCMRFPPVAETLPVECSPNPQRSKKYTHPAVYKDEWCGEFQVVETATHGGEAQIQTECKGEARLPNFLFSMEEFSVRARRVFIRFNICHAETVCCAKDICNLRAEDILESNGAGLTTLNEIRKKMREVGLKLKDER